MKEGLRVLQGDAQVDTLALACYKPSLKLARYDIEPIGPESTESSECLDSWCKRYMIIWWFQKENLISSKDVEKVIQSKRNEVTLNILKGMLRKSIGINIPRLSQKQATHEWKHSLSMYDWLLLSWIHVQPATAIVDAYPASLCHCGSTFSQPLQLWIHIQPATVIGDPYPASHHVPLPQSDWPDELRDWESKDCKSPIGNKGLASKIKAVPTIRPLANSITICSSEKPQATLKVRITNSSFIKRI